MPDIRLSIIVPFYNVEPYIEQCVRSLYNQDIPQEEYEVICVDDCSPDGSRAIVERLQNEYSTLKLLRHTNNKRQGGARNTALKEAKGQYVWFVDSDDYIVSNCLRKLLSIAESNQLEILKFYNVIENKNNHRKLINSPLVSGSELIFDVETDRPLVQRCGIATNLLISSSYIKQNRFQFAENVQYEDDDYAYQLYAFAKRTMIVPEIAYVVRVTPNSTTHRKNDIHRANDMFLQLVRMLDMEPILMTKDSRWELVVGQYIKYAINDEIFLVLRDCSFTDQLSFFYKTRTRVKEFKKYLTRRSYLKLCSFVLWKVL